MDPSLLTSPASIWTPYKTLWPNQLALLHVASDVHFDIACYQGGFGSGKTFIGALLGLIMSQRYPGIRGMAVAKTYPLLRDTTLQMYFEHLSAFGLKEGQDYIWKASQAKLIFPIWGGSEILFRHLERPGKLKSLTLGWIHPEEMSQMTESDFLMLISRLRQPGIARYRLFGTTNPEESKGWIYRFFVKQGGKRTRMGQNGETVTFHYRRIIASSWENKALPAGYVENMLETFDADYARMNIEGQDGDYTRGRVCKSWQDANLQNVQYDPAQTIYLTCDFNVDPMCWEMAHRSQGEYLFFDELCLENTNTAGAAEEFARRYKGHQAGIIITGDASGNNRSTKSQTVSHTDYTIIRNTLTECGFPNVRIDIRTHNPPVLDRVAAWNAMVCNAQGQIRVKVNPNTCPKLVWNCETLQYISGSSLIWEPSAREIRDDFSRTLKFTKHPFDAASYLIERYDPIKLKVSEQDARKSRIIARPFPSIQ